jgi:23S rRNA (uracil-5-)-methyltransferase RumA
VPPDPGQLLTLSIEKPAAGGRMIARDDGRIVLVAGAIPGERVTARVERVAKGVIYAVAVTVEEASVDRRVPDADPRCGGCLYAHVAYGRQLAIKAQVVADAFARIAHLQLPPGFAVSPSAAEGYRMRARLHRRAGRIGFFREGTYDLCDPRSTRQLLPATCDVLDRLGAGLRSEDLESVRELEVSENMDASERVVHLDVVAPIDPGALASVADTDGLSGLTIGSLPEAVSRESAAGDRPRAGRGSHLIAGDPYVHDLLSIEGREVVWRRHVLAFFQNNRYLLRDLVARVVAEVDHGSRVIDLYAGAGLFSVPLAVARGARVTAVEGEGAAASDLEWNARQAGGGSGSVDAVHRSVEAFVAQTALEADALIVDPPRTGLSRDALSGVIRLAAPRIVYVSCDVATLARDARRLADAGYPIASASAFDMFPNTPHVEVVAVFRR